MFDFTSLFNKNSNNSPPVINLSEDKKLPTEPLEVKATKANKLFGENITQPDNSEYVKSYSTSDLIFSCVSYACDIASQVKLKAYIEKDEELEPIKDKKLKAWLQQPNPFQSMSELIYLYIQSYLLTGNAYMSFEKVANKYESWVLNPVKIKIVPHTKRYIQGFLYDDQIAYKAEEIIFFKNPSIDNEYYGQSFLKSLIDPLLLESYATSDLKSFYQNSTIMSGLLTSEYPLSDKQIKSLREQFKKLYGQKGGERFGFLLSGNNLKYQPLKISPKDALLLEALNISEDKIYKVFRMNPLLLGVAKDSVNGTEVSNFKQLYVNNFIRPMLHRMVQQFTTFFRRVLKNDSIVFVEDYDFIPEMNTVLEEKIDAVKQAISIGLLSTDEGRNIIGYNPLEGKYTDSHLAPSFLTGTNPLDLVSGEQLNLAPTNQQPTPQGSTSPDGGSQDGVSRE